MDVRKILANLQYRIQSTREDDPECENAIRLRDRLLAKNGLKLEDIMEVRKTREFERLSQKESFLVDQYFRVTLKIDRDVAPWNLGTYKYRHRPTKFSSFVRIDLTDDEYSRHRPIVDSLVQIFRRKTRELEKKLAEENKSRIEALEYAIYEKANILFPAGWNGSDPVEGDSAPSWGLYEAMKAARDLEDTIFPEMQLTQETLQIEGGR